MEAVVLHKVGFLEYFCPKQGQDFKPSAAPLYPNIGQVPPPRDLAGSDFVSTHSEFVLNCQPIRFVRLNYERAQRDGKSVNRGLLLLNLPGG